ncbi:MAG: hypothetical protein MMC23_002512 [Stictis urceolatum]|nr:hypothetical protein [Stictis urceolata]
MPSFNYALAAGLGLLTSLVQGQIFTVDCQPLLTERGDPILNPGLPRASSHVHAIVGGTGFNLSMSLTLAPDSKNTTCSRSLDHSNYWQPQLYSQTSENSFELIEFQGSAIFYFNRACDYAPGRTQCPSDFKPAPPPAGLRIISGNSTYSTNEYFGYRAPQYNASSFSAQAIQTTCLTETTDFSYPGLPTEPCLRLRAESFFPSCWDGINLDSDDHFSHMAWPVQNYNGGGCPQSHPKAIYSVFYQFFYNTAPYPEWKNWMFAMGDPTGYGLHGDFLQGWSNQTALEQAVYTCDAGSDSPPCSVAVGEGPAIRMGPEIPGYVEEVGLDGSPVPALPGTHPVVGSYLDRKPALK